VPERRAPAGASAGATKRGEMQRRTFMTSGLAALATIAAAPRAFAWTFPGTLAVFAQRLRDARPFALLQPTLSLPAASVIKLVILTGIVREVDAGALRWSDVVRIGAREIVGASERFGNAAPGSTASVERLAEAMVAQSDNTAANVLADHLSFACVNDVARSLGLAQTRLRRHFMDFAARARGIDNTTSAGDMGALLLGVARGARGLYSRVASRTGCRKIVTMMERQEDRDTIPTGIHRHVRIANKTGVLPDVRNDVAIVDPYGSDGYVVALLSQFHPSVTATAYARLRAIAGEIDDAHAS
jgi:beta-lactamase class A